MCLIAQRIKPKAHIPAKVVEHNSLANPDGFGIAWREGPTLRFEKFGPKDKPAFLGLLDRIDKTRMPYTAHFRKATHGDVCADMSHPFPYTDANGDEALVFHNGIISIKPAPGESDTLAFVKRILAHLPDGWWNNNAIRTLVEDYIGWSRILIMTPKWDVYLNRSLWTRENGFLYSVAPLPAPIKFTPSKGVTENLLPYTTPPSMPSENKGWPHAGHVVYPVTQTETGHEEDQYGDAKCSNCGSTGDYFVIEGTRYIDINHKFLITAG